MRRSPSRQAAYRRGPSRAIPAVLLVALAANLRAVEPSNPKAVPKPSGTVYQQQIQPFLARHCLQCHGAEKAEGELRLDMLSPDFVDDDSRDQWLAALERINAGEMPPDEKPQPPAKQVDAIAHWISDQAAKGVAAKRAKQGRVVLRRLNRAEYENTVRDLLGVYVDLKESLPLDSSSEGFDNVGAALHISSFLMERYLDAADTALDVAIVNGPQPPLFKKRLSCKDERHVKHTTEKVFRSVDDALVFFSSSPWQGVTMGQFYPRDGGKYRFRISAYGYQSAGKPVAFRVDAGPMLMGTKNHHIGYFDAPANKPGIVEWYDTLPPRNTIRILPYGLQSAQAVNKVGADKYEGAGLAVQWVEVEGPLYDSWPPESHRRIFGDQPQGPAPDYNARNRVEVVSQDPLVDAERIFRGFVRRAYRRSVTDADLKPYVALVAAKLEEKSTFEQAIRAGLKYVMISPEFLYLREAPGKLDDFALASRLSYFVWSTMPDEELLTLAGEKKLSDPETLHRQVERLLKHPKSAAFTENFLGQWLKLRDLDFTAPDHRLYPEYDEMLRVAMEKETHLFFEEVLKNDLSLTNFIASDFTMLNERLAKHYGIAGVEGHAFRKTPLPPGSHRGGVLTMASVLKVTANGTNTSPVVRGAWVLDRILGTPPSPPPDGVPAVEPDIRGATTIREQLAKHRETASCNSCHAKIDPPGFALESFDVIGGWRENYRSVGRGTAVTIDGRRMPYAKGLAVDPADKLPDGRQFADIDELKRLLLADKDQLARALTIKLVTYATGGAPEAADRPAIDAIVANVKTKDYGLRSLVHEIVRSELFQCK